MVELGVIIVLCGLLAWQEYSNRKERKDLVNRIVAKDNKELVNLELAENTKVEDPKEIDTPPDFVPTDSVSDDEYIKMIKDTLPNG